MNTGIPVLEISGLTKVFGGLRAVSDFAVSVKAGERHGILGPNGAGKTTVYNLVCGVYPVTAGVIRLGDTDITHAPVHRRVRLGLGRTFQVTNLFQDMSVKENVLLATHMATGESTAYVHTVKHLRKSNDKALKTLAELGLADMAELSVSELSYGQQRQLEVALALALEPSVLMLDEPTAGLSQVETDAMVELIKRLPSSLAVVMIEHDLDVIFGVMEEMTVMHRGETICAGDCQYVRQDPLVTEVYTGETRD
jgi:branched-chain amino acid transport system ATP-binding protein